MCTPCAKTSAVPSRMRKNRPAPSPSATTSAPAWNDITFPASKIRFSCFCGRSRNNSEACNAAMISLAIRPTFQDGTIISKGEAAFGEAYAVEKAMPTDQAMELALDREQSADALGHNHAQTVIRSRSTRKGRDARQRWSRCGRRSRRRSWCRRGLGSVCADGPPSGGRQRASGGQGVVAEANRHPDEDLAVRAHRIAADRIEGARAWCGRAHRTRQLRRRW